MNVIKRCVSTEKSLKQMEEENKLIFIVKIKSNKTQIKEAINERFGEEAEGINTLITPKGRKKAYVKFKKDGAALDIATRLGIM